MILNNVLYVPNLSCNLLSIGKLAQEYDVHFKKDKCLIYQGSHLVLAGRKTVDGLYKMQVHTQVPRERPSQQALACIGEHQPSQLAHYRLGHLNYKDIQKLLRSSTGMEHLENKLVRSPCKECAMGKFVRRSFQKQYTERTRISFETGNNIKIHMDYWGPARHKTKSLFTGFLVLMAEPYHLTSVRLTKGKDGEQIANHLDDFITQLEKQTGKTVTHVKSDGAHEFLQGAVGEMCRKRGIRQSHTASYSPQQNGQVERMNRTLVEMARTMLLHANLPPRYWGYAVECAGYIRNRVPTSALDGKSPFEAATGKKPNLSHLRVFGCQVMVRIPTPHRNGKLDPVAKPGIFLGYDLSSTCYIIQLEDGRDILSNDVVFYENQPSTSRDFAFAYQDPEDLPPPASPTFAAVGDGQHLQPKSQSCHHCKKQRQDKQDSKQVGAESVAEQVGAASSELPDVRQTRKSQRKTQGKRNSKRFADEFCGQVTDSVNVEYAEPQTVKQALRTQEAKHWQEAMREEHQALERNGVYKKVTKLPNGVKPLPTKWVFKRKTKADGTFKYKARLVVRGDKQQHGIDYDKTFSPVIQFSTVRAMLILIQQYKYKVKLSDITTAFQNSPMEEEVYVTIDGWLAVLMRALYGLKQASLAWFNELKKFLLSVGLQSNIIDPCLFFRVHGDEKLFVLVYVDDLIIVASSDEILDEFEKELTSKFKANNVSEMDSFLGLEIKMDENQIQIHQTKFLEKLLREYGFHQAKRMSVPMTASGEAGKALQQERPIREVIGSLLYAAMRSRPDIAFAVRVLASQQSKPTDVLWNQITFLLRYLRGTTSYGLNYEREAKFDQEIKLEVYSDASFASEADRKSVSGYVVYMNGNVVEWSSKKQEIIALSTCEAEYISMVEGLKVAVGIRNVFMEMGFKMGKIVLYGDNQGAISLADAQRVTKRSKHIEVRYHWIRAQVEQGIVDLQYVSTNEQVADCLTKPLGKTKFEYFRSKMLQDVSATKCGSVGFDTDECVPE